MKTKLQIKSIFGSILFEHEEEDNSIRKTLETAVKGEADLRGADLRGADLCGADLRGADLCEADLRGADLRGADLCEADLRRADLCEADLRRADLCEADLRRADLGGADLRGADLCEADLGEADLSEANLGEADLSEAKNIPEQYFRICRDDLWAVLCSSPFEVSGLRQALVDGKIDGSTYEGECACLVGTIAKVKGCNYQSIASLKPDSSRPIEMFFTAIKPGGTPDKNDFAKRAVEWIDEWKNNMAAAFGAKS